MPTLLTPDLDNYHFHINNELYNNYFYIHIDIFYSRKNSVEGSKVIIVTIITGCP